MNTCIYDLPRGIVSISITVISDYRRRVRAIAAGEVAEDCLEAYESLNRAVREGLGLVEVGMREELLSDIEYSRGWECSMLSGISSKKNYYRNKRALVRGVARGLGLV